ncbi:FAD-dependent oxidoreductase [Benzoatithermus flavus]|uniref:FAD-dependent oxidoreductase n=1 Tax=Benzoatithermus flavus TaxID=3108223 RepID=A0ABU8XYG8_9PROT
MLALPGLPLSPWVATTPATSYPKLDRDLKVETAVIGGGIVGLTTAFALTRAGRAVAVIEALRVGQQVTGRSTAKITSQHGLIYRYQPG